MTNALIIEDLMLIPPPPWWMNPRAIAAGILAVVFLAWLVRHLLNRPPAAAPATPPPPGPPPHEWALRELAALKERRGALSAYDLAIAVSDILRRYIEARFDFAIRYQTTREFLRAAQDQPWLGASERTLLTQFLEFCDQVKFAQRPATVPEQEGLLTTAEAFVRRASGPVAVGDIPAARASGPV